MKWIMIDNTWSKNEDERKYLWKWIMIDNTWSINKDERKSSENK